MNGRMTTEEAVLWLRRDPASADLVRSSYLDEDATAASDRFSDSEEFRETLRIVVAAGSLGRVLDLGAGTGIASRAFALADAHLVVAVEPDLSDVVGLGCLVEVTRDLPVVPVAAYGHRLPVASESVDVVYCRQVLHHIPDLHPALAECARVLRPGGLFIAVREHVVDDDEQLAQFRAEHVVHQLAGGEGAHSLDRYLDAIRSSGMEVRQVLAPWDSIINAFPDVERAADLRRAPAVLLGRRFGTAGRIAGSLPGLRGIVWRRLRRPRPGRLYTFVARKAPIGAPLSGGRT